MIDPDNQNFNILLLHVQNYHTKYTVYLGKTFVFIYLGEIKKIFNMSKASTIPGLVYLSARDNPSKTAMGFINARKKVDGAEGLWRTENKLYDLENFMKSHPGGSEWIRITKGTDITELFEVLN